MSNQMFSLSAKAVFRLLNGYPNPEDDSPPSSPFDPIDPVVKLIAQLSKYLHRPISDPPTWGGTQRPRNLIPESWQVAAGQPDPTPWLAVLVAQSHTFQLLELDRLTQHLPNQKDQLEGQASDLVMLAVEYCGTLTPSQILLNYLERKKIVFPPEKYPRPNWQELILMANEFYQVGLLIKNEKISGLSNEVAEKLLENGLNQI